MFLKKKNECVIFLYGKNQNTYIVVTQGTIDLS